MAFKIDIADYTHFLTRMHSSRMRTARSSSRLLGEGCLPHCMLGYTHPPGVGLETPPWCGPGDTLPGVGLETPWPDPSTSPLGVGLETPLARPLNLPLGVGLETPPPTWTEFLTHTSENNQSTVIDCYGGRL